jgi:hypothetical protein
MIVIGCDRKTHILNRVQVRDVKTVVVIKTYEQTLQQHHNNNNQEAAYAAFKGTGVKLNPSKMVVRVVNSTEEAEELLAEVTGAGRQ